MNQCFLLTRNEDGDICALAVSKDLTKSKIIEEKAHRRQLEQYAYFDPITTGYNYIKFKSKLIEQNTPGSIISYKKNAAHFSYENLTCAEDYLGLFLFNLENGEKII